MLFEQHRRLAQAHLTDIVHGGVADVFLDKPVELLGAYAAFLGEGGDV